MSISMHAASVPLFRQMLGALAGVLEKGAAFAAARGMAPAELLQARLAPDMFPLARQVQSATDLAKGCIGRLAGADIPKYDDDETEFAQLTDRIARTLAWFDTIPRARIDGSEEKEIVLTMRAGELRFTGERYLMHFAIPNVVFHCATAYDILRHSGVELGKRDFLGAV